MIPILYQTVTEGAVPTSYGLGALSDVIKCEVKEERNGAYELAMEYAAEGIHAEDIEVNRIIKAKPNFTDDPQLFRIYKVSKTFNDRLQISAQHISYDLSGKVITTGSAASCVAACALLEASAGDFTINTDKTVSGAFSVSEPSSVRSWFGGKEGSLLEVFGGEWHYDNYTASLKQDRGQDRGVQIRYGKNLTKLSQVLNMENLVTGVLPYYIDQDDNKTIGTKVPTGLTLDVDRDLAVNFSQDVDPESATPIATQLATLATAYIANNNLTAPLNSITLDFVQLSSLQERVDLCDTVHIIVEGLGINASIKCIKTTWDVLEERYTSTTFGEAQTNIADTIAQAEKKIEEKPSVSFMNEAINHATELITGNLGGYVVFHDSDGNGQPDEILIMDTADISTATKVWRWNSSGLGYSSTGYAGTYGLAMTANGEIVADFIKTGTLNADLIKAGVIEDVGHNSQINMTNGTAIMRDFKAKHWLRMINDSDVVLVSIEDATYGGQVAIGDNNTNQIVTLQAISNGGLIQVANSAGYEGGRLQSDSDGGLFRIRNASNGLAYQLACTSEGGGTAFFNDSGSTKTIQENGQTGEITCVHLTQTSSRKVKENIRPIEDASKILELDAVAFDFKNKARGTDKRGFIAEDVAEILPNLVQPETDDAPASLDYIGMIPYLQAVIKEQDARIKALEAKLNGTSQS